MKLRVLNAFGDVDGLRQPGDVYEESEVVAAIRIEQGLCKPAGKGAPETAVMDTKKAERAVRAAPVAKAPMRKPVAKRKR